jgi:glycosyltransferase involved in cell wall biosynthesis
MKYSDNKLPLVSIITPTYNHGKFISDCIDSVLKQSYQNWEMIIIDDGSTDNTFAIAREYENKDSRIKAFTQNNIGIFRLGETYNLALSKAAGKYAAILEGDDIWFPEKLTLQVDAMENNPEAVLCWGKAYRVKPDLSEYYSLSPNDADLDADLFSNNPIGTVAKKTLLGNFFMSALTLFMLKSSLDEIGGYVQSHNLPLIDVPTTLHLSMKGKFVYVNEPLGAWRIYPSQVTKTYSVEMEEGFYKFSLEFFDKYQKLINIEEVDETKIYNRYKKAMVISYSRAGRYKLIRKDFKGAQKDYINSIFRFGIIQPVWKLRSFIGLIFSFFHWNVEGLAKMLGKHSYK